jgi:peptidoglycan/LPS O-acetylase OafA/YrhL
MSAIAEAIPGQREELAVGRQAWMDNLRVAVITGVIAFHVATAYLLDISWYYQEQTASKAAVAVATAVFVPTALFGMAVLFLVAGMMTARSVARKGSRPFWRDRLLKLGLPIVAYLLVVDPATSVLGSWGSGDYLDFATMVRYEFTHTGSGPMWFVIALLVFSLTYALWRRLRPARSDADRLLRPRHLVTAAAVIVVASFVVRLVWPFTADTPLALNLWEWPQMAVLFALGALAEERGWLDPPPAWLRRACLRAGAVAAIAVLIAIAVGATTDPFLGGWHLQALAEPVCEATIAVSMSFWVALWFSDHVTCQGRFAGALARASYATYVIHAPIVVAFSVAFAGLAVAVELKFLAVAVFGITVSYVAGWLVTRRPHPDSSKPRTDRQLAEPAIYEVGRAER